MITSLPASTRIYLLQCVAAIALSVCPARCQTAPVYSNPRAPLEARVSDLLGRLSQDEKLSLLTGGSFCASNAIPRLGVGALRMLGAGQGAGGSTGPESAGRATLFPAAITQASTWEPDLAWRIGKAMGDETLNKTTGWQVLLGPAMNVMRSPLCGRNGEYFGEDPYLASRLAVSVIEGTQSTGCAACAKHYAANNEEVDRGSVDVRVSERTLREIYLPAFEASTREAHVWSVMASYNKVNGYHSTANKYLLTDILKDDWGWDGVVMSDWGAVHEVNRVINAGCDLEMPGPGFLTPPAIRIAMDSGAVKQEAIDSNVRRILRAMIRTGLANPVPRKVDNSVLNSAQNQKLTFDVASRGIVLLKNDGHLLPLDASKVHSIAIIGPAAAHMQYGAAGSPDVKPYYSINPIEGISRRAGKDVKIEVVEGLTPGPNAHGDEKSYAEAAAAAARADVAIVLASTMYEEGEGRDRSSMDLPAGQADLINAVAAANKNTIVVLNNGAPVTLTPWLKNVPALLDAWFPGQEGGHALAAILFGDINPSGKLPCTFGARREDYPDYGNFPGTKGIVKYPEGIYVGYRHFDKNRIDPVYPFGYGLSYTTFAYSNLRFSKPALAARGRVNALVDIANTGKRKGAEVVELYVRDPAPRVDRPVRELKGFAKIDLAPGQKGTVSIPLSGRSLAFCDVPGKCWRAYKGAYEIEVGASSRDLRLRAKLKLAANYAEPVAHMGQAPPPPERLADMEKRLKLVDLAKGCPATASTQEKKDTTPSAAFDGDDSTYWSSAFKDPQWLQVDLGKPTMVGGVGIDWTIAYSTTYRIQTSMDGAQWKDVYSTTQGQGEVEILHFKPVSARYVRFYGEKRASKWGHAFYTFAVYGR